MEILYSYNMYRKRVIRMITCVCTHLETIKVHLYVFNIHLVVWSGKIDNSLIAVISAIERSSLLYKNGTPYIIYL